MNKQQPLVYIVILNWNGWRDTVECLESIYRLNYSNYKVVVCDNFSSDDSVAKIFDWAKGIFCAYPNNSFFNQLVIPPVPKPLTVQLLHNYERVSELNSTLTVISNEINRGYGGGINSAIKLILDIGGHDFIWILNNDTVVHPDALIEMVIKAECTEDVGLCGSTVLYYDNPDIVQYAGGFTYNKWLQLSKSLFGGCHRSELANISEVQVERSLFGVQGASILVSYNFIIDIGLLSEEYFLYFEEQDWAARNDHKFKMLYASRSIIYHREGSSTGAHKRCLSYSADYYLLRSRMLFTIKHYPYCFPFALLGMTICIINRLRRNQLNRVSMILGISIEAINVFFKKIKALL